MPELCSRTVGLAGRDCFKPAVRFQTSQSLKAILEGGTETVLEPVIVSELPVPALMNDGRIAAASVSSDEGEDGECSGIPIEHTHREYERLGQAV